MRKVFTDVKWQNVTDDKDIHIAVENVYVIVKNILSFYLIIIINIRTGIRKKSGKC